ncbi:MAG: GPR endopeptidase [Lachnospiraceae bacterium]|nr:GPR endopeptidase [Lachnospiraceae bacterium]
MTDRMQRTDLAVELQENLEDKEILSGVRVSTRVNEDNDIKETRIVIDSEEGSVKFGKPIGTYITIESEELRLCDEDYHVPMSQALCGHLRKMIGTSRRILVAGLGNRAVTPDALGPYVVDNLYITRHLLQEELIHTGYEISALAPGVMAQTGMESQELLQAVVREMKPDLMIVIDALAAMNSDRLNKTIQLSDSGIAPGSGVGNHRKAITEESMGVKVIAIGVPTVISVPAIIEDAMDVMLAAFGRSGMREAVEELTDQERYELAGEMLKPYLAKMYVTPKNIDEAVKRISYTISEAINQLHHSYI